MSVGFDDVLLLLHVVFFAYWLGTDLGVFYSANYTLKADIGVEARAYCAKILNFLDQPPRIAMVATFTIGASLSILRGWADLAQWWLIPIWTVGVLWTGAVIYLYVNGHQPEKIKTIKTIDFNFRLFMIGLLTVVAVASLMGMGITDQPWLALKVLTFAGTMICGVIVRVVMKNFGASYGPMMKGTATPEQVATAQATMARAKKAVMGIWALLIIATALGLWKPG
ncbi:MAG: hypothetical protein FJX59_04940 [Alphaproteobacteria bacterium]|nr:hypothetical protein [Alphaproteobacteria bacterium]